MATEHASLDRLSLAEKKGDHSVEITKEVDLVAYYEEAAGRLVVDPGCVVIDRYSDFEPTVTNSLVTH